MKTQTPWQSCCVLFALAIAIAPVVQAADQERILYARAIGEEPIPPAAPEQGTKTPTPAKKTAPAAPAAEKKSEAKEESKPVSKTAVWIGIGVAALLAAAGGGGGGGGSSTPPHP